MDLSIPLQALYAKAVGEPFRSESTLERISRKSLANENSERTCRSPIKEG